MKTSSIVALGLGILSVSLVVWWQIFDAGSLQTAVTTPTTPIERPSNDELPNTPVGNEPELPTTNTPFPAPGNNNGAGADPVPPVVACTEEAKICPDGSSVGRVGPRCEFAPCPTTNEPQPDDATVYRCTPEMKQAEVCTMEYAPVCGLREVQCITTPCNPIPETFGNACGACATSGVNAYTVGECSLAQ